MTRRLLAALALAAAMTFLMVSPASAQTDPVSPAPEVLDEQIVTPAPKPVEVKGSTVSGLPVTGTELGGIAIAGFALTAAGVALAATARKRRTHIDAA